MARYEVIERRDGHERVHTVTRRENGAIAERDRLVQSTYENDTRHASKVGGRCVQGPEGHRDPNAIVVGYYDRDGKVYNTVITFRRVGGKPEPDPDVDPEPWLASIIAFSGVSL